MTPDRARVLHDDLVGTPAIPIGDRVLPPAGWHGRANLQLIAVLSEAENRFETDTIHPACRAGVPCPAAAAEMSSGGIDVSGHDEWLDLVYRHFLRGQSVGEWVEHLKQRERTIAVATEGRGEHRPQRPMRVLGAILAHARDVALDVPRVVRALVEWRREQHEQSCVLADQMFLEGLHRLRLPCRRAGAGQHAPALRDGVDATLLTLMRA